MTKLINLRQWKRGSEVDNEIRLKIPDCNFPGIHDELPTPKNPRAWGDKSRPKLHKHMEEVKKVE